MKYTEFRAAFIAQFLATWSATNYNDYCARGMQEALAHPPVEDAHYLASKTWDELKEHGIDL